jgi:hypothetical protein
MPRRCPLLAPLMLSGSTVESRGERGMAEVRSISDRRAGHQRYADGHRGCKGRSGGGPSVGVERVSSCIAGITGSAELAEGGLDIKVGSSR